MNLNEVLNDPPKPHADFEGELMVFGLTEAALRFIYENINDRCNTLETGCGLSTVVFALTGSCHTVIAQAPNEIEITKSYCSDRGIPTSQITFVAQPSQKVLPLFDSSPLDLVLIDGGHGFPTPYLDWFYTAGKLKKGGFLIVDDIGLWTCQILRDFLIEQPQWELVEEHTQRTSIFRKLEDGSEWLEWTAQPRVARGGRVKWINGQIAVNRGAANSFSAFYRALDDLKRGNIQVLAAKIVRKLSRSK
ncbi:MAG: class I SAM-dependent methyltransferase [Pyrinomonadaceae bacterium]